MGLGGFLPYMYIEPTIITLQRDVQVSNLHVVNVNE